MNKNLFDSIKSPVLAGLFFILLSGCQSLKTPDQVTLKFWQAIANDDLITAKLYVSADTKQLLQASDPAFKDASFLIGQIVIDADLARVETTANRADKTTTRFTTYLVRQDQRWQIDYQRTQRALSGRLFNGLFKSLEDIGKRLNEQLEQQVPQLEKEMESFGQQLKKQLDKLGEELEKSLTPPEKKDDPYKDSI